MTTTPVEDAPEPATGRTGTFGSLSVPAFRTLWLNSLFLIIGIQMFVTANAVVAHDLTGTNRAVGLVVFGQGLAMLLLTPIGGASADRLPKRLILMLVSGLLGAIAFGTAALVLTDSVTLGFLAAASFGFGACLSFFGPSQMAYIGDVVELERRSNAVALVQVAIHFSRSTGPVVAGALLAWDSFGAGGVYITVGMLWLVAMFVAWKLPSSPAAKRAHVEPVLRQVRLGLAHVAENPPLKQAMVGFVAITMVGFSTIVVLPAFTQDVLGTGKAGFGTILGLNAVGSLAAALTVAAFVRGNDSAVWTLRAALAFGLTTIVLGLMPSFPLALVAMLAVGFTSGAFQTLASATFIHASDPAYFGRVISISMMAWSLTNLAGLLAGAMADIAGERAILSGSGVVLCVLTLLLMLWGRLRPTGSQLKTAGPST